MAVSINKKSIANRLKGLIGQACKSIIGSKRDHVIAKPVFDLTPWGTIAAISVMNCWDIVPPQPWIKQLLAASAQQNCPMTIAFDTNCKASPLSRLLVSCGHEVSIKGSVDKVTSDAIEELTFAAGKRPAGWMLSSGEITTKQNIDSEIDRAINLGFSWIMIPRGQRSEGMVLLSPANKTSSPPHLNSQYLSAVMADRSGALDVEATLSLVEKALNALENGYGHLCLNIPQEPFAVHLDQLISELANRHENLWLASIQEVVERLEAVSSVQISRSGNNGLCLSASCDVPRLSFSWDSYQELELCFRRDDGKSYYRLPKSAMGKLALDLQKNQEVFLEALSEQNAKQWPYLSLDDKISTSTKTTEHIETELNQNGICLPDEVRFEDINHWIKYGVRQRWVLQGAEPDQNPAYNNTFNYNGDMVPRRANALLDFISSAFQFELTDKRIADVGSGYGGVGLYLYYAGNARSLEAIERSPGFIGVLQDAIQAGNVSEIETVHTAIDYIEWDEDSLDCIVFNDVFVYTTYKIEQILEKASRALSPGGLIMFKSASRLTAEDQFTKILGAQLIPPSLADRAVQYLTDSNTTRSIHRLLSHADLVWHLNRHGFREIKFWGTNGWQRTGRESYACQPFMTYFMLGAIKI